MALASTYFNAVSPWKDMVTATIDGQSMVWIPKFYYRVHTPTSGTYSGKKCLEVTAIATAGFFVHPAFMKAGVEIDGFYISSYECSVDASVSTKASSVVNSSPLVSVSFTTMKARCLNRNVSGQSGWHLWNIYELAAIQILCLIESGTPDVQTKIGTNTTSAMAVSGSTGASWRGIYELWSNAWHMVDGIKGNGTSIQVLDRLGNGTYIDTATNAVTSAGYPVTMLDASGTDFNFNDIFMVKTVDATASNGTFGDNYGGAISGFVCRQGGAYNSGTSGGLFSLSCTNDTSYSSAVVGGRLAKN